MIFLPTLAEFNPVPDASSCIACLYAVVHVLLQKEMQGDICNACSRDISDWLYAAEIGLPKPHSAGVQIRTTQTALPPCCWGCQWGTPDEPGLERKTKSCIPDNFCHDFILRYLIFHIGFPCIANTFFLTGCILKWVFQLRRAQAGGYVGLNRARLLPMLPGFASSVWKGCKRLRGSTAQRPG